MSIRRQSDGRYVIRYYEAGTKKSSYRQENLGHVTRDEAVRIYRQRTAQASTRKGRALHALTFDTLATAYLDSAGRKMAPKSRERAEAIIRTHLSPAFGAMLIPAIRPFHVERFMNLRIDAGANPATVNREWNVLKAILNYGERMELIEVNPLRRGSVATFKVADSKLIYFEPDEWQRFVAAFDDPAAWQAHVANVRRLGPVKVEEHGERRHGGGRRPDSDATAEYLRRLRATVPVFQALLLTGCRLGEILSLRWSDVDLNRNTLTVIQQKTRKQKVLPIEDDLRTLLMSLPRGIGQAPVFTREDARAFSAIRGAAGVCGRAEALRHPARVDASQPASHVRVVARDVWTAAPDDSGASRPRGRADDDPLRSPVPHASVRGNADSWQYGNCCRRGRGFTRKCSAGNAWATRVNY